MTDIYVYYRVRSELADLMLPHVRAMQQGLRAALEQAAIDAHLPITGERHVEVFTDLPACA